VDFFIFISQALQQLASKDICAKAQRRKAQAQRASRLIRGSPPPANMRSTLLFAPACCVARAGSNGSCGSFSIDARAPIFTTAPYYASYNIDSSTDREFFMIDWTDPALVSAATGLSVSGAEAHIRFGGTGNNFLRYETPSSPCPSTGKFTCLNQSTWTGISALAVAAKAPLIFGVNFFPNGTSKNHSFDPTNAVDFFTTAHSRGDLIWGVENGNEINELVTAEEQAAGLLALDDALAPVFGNDPRPVLIGPDGESSHLAAFLRHPQRATPNRLSPFRR
jgi:hypothetical protein